MRLTYILEEDDLSLSLINVVQLKRARSEWSNGRDKLSRVWVRDDWTLGGILSNRFEKLYGPGF